MKVPTYITIQRRGLKLKPGMDCPKEYEPLLKKAMEAKTAQAKALAKHFAPYADEEKVIETCSPYPDFNHMVLVEYKKLREKEAVKEKGKE